MSRQLSGPSHVSDRPHLEDRRMATKPNPVPDNYRRITPALVVRGAAKAIEFYSEVFEATERYRFPGPGGTISHAEIQIGDSVVILEDEFPERGTKAPPADGLSLFFASAMASISLA